MTHEHQFPESDESGEARADRALAALQYEERAGLGFRRRRFGIGDPYAEPAEYTVRHQQTLGELWGGYMGSMAAVLGGIAIFYRPLLLCTIAAFLGVGALIPGGTATKFGRIGLTVACTGFVLGMLFAIALKRPVL